MVSMNHRRLAAALLMLVAAACVSEQASTPTSPSFAAGAPAVQRYIVAFQDDVRDVPGLARALAQAHGSAPDFVYEHALHGFAALLPEQAVARLRADARVKYVEADQEMRVVQQTLPWGIDRIDADISSTLAGNGSDSVTNVNVYIIDTGIDTRHPDLNVVQHVNFAGGPNKDCNGHGTHVSGTVAAKDDAQGVVGVVPGAPRSEERRVGKE